MYNHTNLCPTHFDDAPMTTQMVMKSNNIK